MKMHPRTLHALSALVAEHQCHRALLELVMAIDGFLVTYQPAEPLTHEEQAREAELWSAIQEARVTLRQVSELNRSGVSA